MAASIFQGTAVKLLKNVLRFKDGTEITSTEAGYLAGTTSDIQTQLNSKVAITDVFSLNSVSGVSSLTANESYIVNTSGGTASLTLPAVASDIFVRIKDNGSANSNNITVTPASGTIDGSASHVINSDYGSVTVVCDGTNWFIL